ncbi:MAG TPA: SirB2 family protein [Burkholderiales bacterium]|nr:SirB2 family protein [Burkholderiales bacterium]
MSYVALKGLHVACVVTSYSLFVLRGVWMLRGSARLQRRWVKVLPHVVDTVLLASAVLLAMTIRQYPFVAPWLTAKVLGLAVYIVLGVVALKRGRTPAIRLSAWIAAQLTFFYIVAVAVTHTPWPLRG